MSKNYPGPSRSSGFVQIWSFWRHCCCIYGWYPALVAPIVTAASLLDLYSTIGCEFIELDVGFTPSNQAWNQSTVDLGLFYLNNDDEFSESNAWKDAFAEGCNKYPSAFEEFFIDGDKTWTAARIMAIIAGSAGLLATVTAWLMVITPLPAGFFWPGVLLPSVMVGFLAQGSKFLFFDTKICQGFVWFPFGENALPRTASSCTLGRTGIFAIAAGAVYFLALLLVCLKTPERRHLQEYYGKMQDDEEEGGGLREDEEIPASLGASSDEENPYFAPIAPLPASIVASGSSKDEIFERSDGVPSEEMLERAESNVSELNIETKLTTEHVSAYDCVPGALSDGNDQDEDKENHPDTRDDTVSSTAGHLSDVRLGADSSPANPTKSTSSDTLKQPLDEEEDDEERGYLPYQTKAKTPIVSESRLSKKEKMEVGKPDEELIDRFVLEFEKSFATDDESNAEPESISSMASF